MGSLIEEQAVIDCLTNTAKYYERKDADEWTKGIHYGLLHGLDNILDNVSPVEAIPKADYENRLKADLITMLVALQLQFASRHCKDMRDCWWLIEDKINALKAETEDHDGQTSN